MRRLPIYFLIDVSESMVGEPIQQVEEGLATIIKELKTDPNSIETVWVSIIVFAGQAKTLVPLQEIVNFYPPRFPIGSGTSLSRGLGHLMFELRKNQVKTTHERKGDWKPIVFLFTDGVPTDNTKVAIEEWKNNWARTANLIAVAFGDETNPHELSQLTENIIHFNNAEPGAYKKFFKWVTDSIKTSSESVEGSGTGFELAKLDKDTVTKMDMPNSPTVPSLTVDPNFVVLTAKCQNTKRLYLMKYRKFMKPSNLRDLDVSTMAYRLVGAYQVDNTYTELTDEYALSGRPTTVNSNELLGAPACPCCGNQFGLAVCSCGKIHCIGEEEESTCPWCGSRGKYTSSGGEGGGFDVGRSQG
jgi:uncharacterized protein YegL